MGFVLLLVILLVLMPWPIRLPSRRHDTPQGHRTPMSASRSGHAAPAKHVSGDPDRLERSLTSRLLAGKLDQAGYRDAMAGLAATTAGVAACSYRTTPAVADDPRELLGRLGATLPELPSTMLCSALTLVCSGAGVDELIHTLHLTRVEARTIVSAVNA